KRTWAGSGGLAESARAGGVAERRIAAIAGATASLRCIKMHPSSRGAGCQMARGKGGGRGGRLTRRWWRCGRIVTDGARRGGGGAKGVRWGRSRVALPWLVGCAREGEGDNGH